MITILELCHNFYDESLKFKSKKMELMIFYLLIVKEFMLQFDQLLVRALKMTNHHYLNFYSNQAIP